MHQSILRSKNLVWRSMQPRVPIMKTSQVPLHPERTFPNIVLQEMMPSSLVRRQQMRYSIPPLLWSTGHEDLWCWCHDRWRVRYSSFWWCAQYGFTVWIRRCALSFWQQINWDWKRQTPLLLLHQNLRHWTPPILLPTRPSPMKKRVKCLMTPPKPMMNHPLP